MRGARNRTFSFQVYRQDLYKRGGIVSITSQIFTVDMLTSDIPTHLITGILVLHAERCAVRILFLSCMTLKCEYAEG